MMKHSFLIKLFVPLCALALSSCLVSNFSGVADAVGREKLVSEPNDGHPKDLRVYKLGNAYYVEMQATWQHVSERSFYSWDPFQGKRGGLHFWRRHNSDAPKETYLRLLSAEQVDGLLQKKVAEAPDGTPTLISATEFDYARAKRCTPRPRRFPKYHDESKMVYGEADDYYYCFIHRERCSWAHYSMQPVSWLAWVVDIPLTVALNTPLYLLIAPYVATEQVMIQTTGDVPWLEEEPLPGPVITPVEQ